MRMERRDAFEFYVDYLLSSPRTATATGLSAVLDNALKHDYISDRLVQNELDNKAFWHEPGRRAVEEMHKSLKQNALLGNSPARHPLLKWSEPNAIISLLPCSLLLSWNA